MLNIDFGRNKIFGTVVRSVLPLICILPCTSGVQKCLLVCFIYFLVKEVVDEDSK